MDRSQQGRIAARPQALPATRTLLEHRDNLRELATFTLGHDRSQPADMSQLGILIAKVVNGLPIVRQIVDDAQLIR